MTEIVEILRKQLEPQGVIPFADFMRLSLYCPKYGYYEQTPGRIGRTGDFFTSVSTGSLFGELLAFQCAEWLQSLPPGPVQLVEAGAHNGQLAADILGWLSHYRPALLPSLQYYIIEPSERRRTWQRVKLEHFAEQVRWFDSLAALSGGNEPRSAKATALPLSLPPVAASRQSAGDRDWTRAALYRDAATPSFTGPGSHAPAAPLPRSHAPRLHSPGVRGVIFSNELLDAFPVRRLGWDAAQRRWFEWGVAMEKNGSVEERLVWEKMPRPADFLASELCAAGLELPPELQAVLPDEFTVEICPEAAGWWQQAASVLTEGKLVTIDYGCRAEQLLAPERRHGTLRAYYHHHCTADVLAQPGEQDLTAHVNFTQLERVGEEAGLKTEGFVSQEQFFTRLIAKTSQSDSAFKEWTPARVRQFQTLTHPDFLGRPFSVLVQRRGTYAPACNS